MSKKQSPLGRMSEFKNVDSKFWPTGSYLLEEAIGASGFPGGLITEIEGHAGVGKSIISLMCGAHANAQGYDVIYVDAEDNFVSKHYLSWFENMGLNANQIRVPRKYYTEEVIEEIIDELEKDAKSENKIGVVIIDSMPAFLNRCKDILEREAGSSRNGYPIQLWNHFLTKFKATRHQAAFVYINHLIANYNRYGGEGTKGGNNTKYMKHLALNVIRKNSEDNNKVGIEISEEGTVTQTMSVKITKNKITGRDNVVVDGLVFDKRAGNYDLAHELIVMSTKRGLIDRQGAWFKVGEKKYQGSEKLKTGILEDDELSTYLLKECGKL